MSGNNGGAEFACASELGHQEGMSLRDYFAGQALAHIADSCYGSLVQRADECYALADAMLAQRDKEATNGK